MNVYCMRARSCEDKPGYLQNAEGERCFDGPSCRVADDVIIMCSNFFDASSLCVRTMHDKPVCPESILVNRRPYFSLLATDMNDLCTVNLSMRW